MRKLPEQYRSNLLPAPPAAMNRKAGLFFIPHPTIVGYFYQVIVSDGLGWDHVSISMRKEINKRGESIGVNRCPTWLEMCFIKDLFFEKHEYAVQFHPPEADYVSHHDYCLHLWRSKDKVIPLPDPILVGPRSSIKKPADIPNDIPQTNTSTLNPNDCEK